LSDIIKIIGLVAWPPCRLVEVWVECKRDLNVSRALLVHEHTISKRIGCKYVAVPVEFGSVVRVRVECKRDLNAYSTLLVLERTILKRI